MASFRIERDVAAPPEIVFEVLTDHEGYASITQLRKSVLEREGESAPNGVGAIRSLHSVGPALREEVVAYEPPHRFSYKLLSGLPVRDHLGTVELTAADGGTHMTYTVKSIPTVPLVGGGVIAATKLAVGSLISGIAKESERRASDAR
jgi:uncharacterized protein YndB with AHSA1/START domain